MQFKDKVVFITGANRGIGKALVQAALKHGVKKVYATARVIGDLPDFNDSRVVPVTLDITNVDQVQAAATLASDVQMLINNAGALAFANVIEGSIEDLQQNMQVNYFGTLSVTRAFVPVITQNGGGAIASISSIAGLASMTGIGGYSASKAALFSAIQGSRTELKSKNIAVFGIFPGPIDTDMASQMDMQKTSAADTAENIVQAIEAGTEDIFPDARSAQLGVLWMSNPKELEREFAAM
ncbi:SDR family oxidoreductase [Neisseriaceae bacterium TC5R-5]|nr:SDR family oxidoreductase [Neisseriaceae bacterium TC5R-5]